MALHRTARLCLALALGVGALPPAMALTTLSFTSTVGSINPGAPGFPSTLAAVSPGATVTGSISYDETTPAATNTFSGNFALATLYRLSGASFTLDVGGVVFDSWSGDLLAFVWNDQNTVGSGLNDGLEFLNFAAFNTAQFQLGNLLLPTGTLGSAALPAAAPGGIHLLQLQSAGQTPPWLSAGPFGLTTAVPEAPSALMAALGLGLIVARRYRRQV